MTTRSADLTLQVDGTRTAFTLPSNAVPGSLNVHWNGSRLRPGMDFAETTSATFLWLLRPKFPAPRSADTLLVQYEEAGGDPIFYPTVIASGIDPTV